MGERIPQLLSIPQVLIKKFIDSGVIILQLKTEPYELLMLDDELKTKVTGYNFRSNLVTSHIDMRFLVEAFNNTILCNSIKFDMLFSSSYKGYQLLKTICESSDMVCSLYAGNIKSHFLDTDDIAGDTVKGNVLIVEPDINSLEKSIRYIKDKGGLPIAAIILFTGKDKIDPEKNELYITQHRLVRSGLEIPIFSTADEDDLLEYLDHNNKKEKVMIEETILVRSGETHNLGDIIINEGLYFQDRYGERQYAIDIIKIRIEKINNKIQKLWKKSEHKATVKSNSKVLSLTHELDCLLFLINKLTKE